MRQENFKGYSQFLATENMWKYFYHTALLLFMFVELGYTVDVPGLLANIPQVDSVSKKTFSKPTCDTLSCVSVVSYCSLQEKCVCNPAVNCSCCRECAICLGKMYDMCCDCVGMCEKNVSSELPTMTSTVDFLQDPNSDLFQSLTNEPIPQLRAKIVKFPIIEELAVHHHRRKQKPVAVEHVVGKGWTYGGMTASEYWENLQLELRNTVHFDALCTVAYMDKCMALKECHMSCYRMGATSHRWFHNGCCECVGPSCLNYGSSYPKCWECKT